MPVEVVEVGPGDHRLWAEAVALFRGVQHDRHHQFLSDPATVALVARDGESVVGWAWGFRQLRADGDSMLLLYEIEVVESERRRGIGRELVVAFLHLGRSEGYRKVWLFTEADNHEAVSLYEETGVSCPIRAMSCTHGNSVEVFTAHADSHGPLPLNSHRATST